MLIRKLFRTAWRYKAQFLSMTLMVAIGVGVFLGFNIEWKSIEADTSAFLKTPIMRISVFIPKWASPRWI